MRVVVMADDRRKEPKILVAILLRTMWGEGLVTKLSFVISVVIFA